MEDIHQRRNAGTDDIDVKVWSTQAIVSNEVWGFQRSFED